MPYCPACGRENAASEVYCPQCGARQAAASAVPTSASVAEPYARATATPAPTTIVDRPGARYIGKWNWGAAFLYPYWLMNHRRVGLGIALFVLGLIPIVNFASLILLFVFGVRGNQIAVESGRFTDEEQFVAVQNAWRNWGIAIIVLGTLAGVLGGLADIGRSR